MQSIPIMPHTEDFADAHSRHWSDAEQLFQLQRWANADYLYGLSAECGLKAVLVAKNQPVEGRFRKHIDKLWPVFVSFIDGRAGSDYRHMLPCDRPFKNWRIRQRYQHRDCFDAACVEVHREAAQAVRDIVQYTIQDGGP